jgi:hypothetical protein
VRRSLLLVCKACLENGCSIIVRAARQSAEAKQARIEASAAMEAGRQEREVEAVATASATTVASLATTIAVSHRVATPVATSAPKLKSRKRTRCVCLYLL